MRTARNYTVGGLASVVTSFGPCPPGSMVREVVTVVAGGVGISALIEWGVFSSQNEALGFSSGLILTDLCVLNVVGDADQPLPVFARISRDLPWFAVRLTDNGGFGFSGSLFLSVDVPPARSQRRRLRQRRRR